MPQDLTGKKILLTAAAQGIGRASALAFAAAGAQVLATDINAAGLKTLASEDAAIRTSVLDVRDSGAIQRFSEETGRIDVLFNCAGYVQHGSILECSEEDWDFSIDLNVTSMYRMCRAFLPGMLGHGSGKIINMSSVASSIKGVPNRFVYAASKAAIIGLTKAIAADFVSQGICCNAICPGTVDTPSLEERIASQGDVATVRAAFISRQPMGRLGQPQEIAALAVYLASDAASFITGQAIAIDGGWSI